MEYFESILSTDTITFIKKISQCNNPTEVKEILRTNKLILFQWRLSNLICKHTDESSTLTDSPILRWISTDVDILEQMLTSGYVLEHRWANVISILELIINRDLEAKTSSYRKRLAVAIALTFSTPVLSFASYDRQIIDPLKRYLSFVKCVEEEKFFPVHTTISTWLLRYVVASWAEDDELEWARNNILPEFKCPSLVGEATHCMVPYKLYNTKGVSIHDGAIYYDNKPQTLALLKEYGAVCGGISKFGSAMAQAFGIPACPIGQPDHCAFLWWKEGKWVMSNGCSGITKSNTHSGIQWSWNERCDYQLLFDKAQNVFAKYSLSEQLRWVAALVSDRMVRMELLYDAIKMCPANYLIWRDLVRFMVDNNNTLNDESFRSRFKLWYEKVCKDLNESEQVISAFSKVTSSVQDKMEDLTDRTESEWYCRQQEAWIELEFDKMCTIERVEIQWWGISFAAHYSILVAGEDEQYIEEKSEKDAYENPVFRTQYNEWSRLTGWSKPTKKVKLLLRDGHLDPWDMDVLIGIRQFNVYGKHCDTGVDSQDYLKSMICYHFVDFPLIGKDLIQQLTWGVVLSSDCMISASVQDHIENLIDGTGSEWYCKQTEAWIELEFDKMCTIEGVEIQWWGISFAAHYSILVAGEDEQYIEEKSEKDAYENPVFRTQYNEWSRLTGWSKPTKKVKLLLRDGHLDPWDMDVLIGIRQFNVYGRHCL